MEQLAILGGKPVRESKIYYGRQCVGEDDIEVVAEVLRGPYITCGPKVCEAERKLRVLNTLLYAVMAPQHSIVPVWQLVLVLETR